MVVRKFKFSVIAVCAILVIAIAVGLLSSNPNLGLDFNGQFLIKADIKEAFNPADICRALQSLKGDLGDISVTSATGESGTQALIRVQYTDEALTTAVINKVVGLYESAVYRGTSFISAPFSRGNFIGLVGMLIGAALIASIYIFLRQGLYSGLGAVVSAVGAMLTANAVMVMLRIPIRLSYFMAASLTAMILSLLYSVLLQRKTKAYAYDINDLSQAAKAADERVSDSLRGILFSAAGIAVFAAVGLIAGGSVMYRFLAAVAIGGVLGLLYPIFIGLPVMILTPRVFKNRLRTKRHVKAIK